MRDLGLLAVLHLLITPVVNLSAIPLFSPLSTAAQYVAIQIRSFIPSRAYLAIESLHVAADSRVGIARKSCVSSLNACERKVAFVTRPSSGFLFANLRDGKECARDCSTFDRNTDEFRS